MQDRSRRFASMANDGGSEFGSDEFLLDDPEGPTHAAHLSSGTFDFELSTDANVRPSEAARPGAGVPVPERETPPTATDEARMSTTQQPEIERQVMDDASREHQAEAPAPYTVDHPEEGSPFSWELEGEGQLVDRYSVAWELSGDVHQRGEDESPSREEQGNAGPVEEQDTAAPTPAVAPAAEEDVDIAWELSPSARQLGAGPMWELDSSEVRTSTVSAAVSEAFAEETSSSALGPPEPLLWEELQEDGNQAGEESFLWQLHGMPLTQESDSDIWQGPSEAITRRATGEPRDKAKAREEAEALRSKAREDVERAARTRAAQLQADVDARRNADSAIAEASLEEQANIERTAGLASAFARWLGRTAPKRDLRDEFLLIGRARPGRAVDAVGAAFELEEMPAHTFVNVEDRDDDDATTFAFDPDEDIHPSVRSAAQPWPRASMARRTSGGARPGAGAAVRNETHHWTVTLRRSWPAPPTAVAPVASKANRHRRVRARDPWSRREDARHQAAKPLYSPTPRLVAPGGHRWDSAVTTRLPEREFASGAGASEGRPLRPSSTMDGARPLAAPSAYLAWAHAAATPADAAWWRALGDGLSFGGKDPQAIHLDFVSVASTTFTAAGRRWARTS